MRVMQAVLRDRLRELPDLAVAPGAWEDLWRRRHPAAWSSLVRKMVSRAAADPAAFLALDAAGGMATADADQLQGGGAGPAAAEAVPAAANPADVIFVVNRFRASTGRRYFFCQLPPRQARSTLLFCQPLPRQHRWTLLFCQLPPRQHRSTLLFCQPLPRQHRSTLLFRQLLQGRINGLRRPRMLAAKT